MSRICYDVLHCKTCKKLSVNTRYSVTESLYSRYTITIQPNCNIFSQCKQHGELGNLKINVHIIARIVFKVVSTSKNSLQSYLKVENIR